jgi:hypothetical protein
MSRSYAIWHEINACIYQGSKNYGGKDTAETTVRVGTSKSNSEVLVRHVTTRRTAGAFTVFTFGVDTGTAAGVKPIKRLWMHTKTRKWYTRKPPELRGENGSSN